MNEKIESKESYYIIYVLVGGTQIITEVNNGIWKEPMNIFMSREQGISFIPMIQFGDPSVKTVSAVDSSHILFDYKPNEQILQNYKEITTKLQAQRSGIIV